MRGQDDDVPLIAASADEVADPAERASTDVQFAEIERMK